MQELFIVKRVVYLFVHRKGVRTFSRNFLPAFDNVWTYLKNPLRHTSTNLGDFTSFLLILFYIKVVILSHRPSVISVLRLFFVPSPKCKSRFWNVVLPDMTDGLNPAMATIAQKIFHAAETE